MRQCREYTVSNEGFHTVNSLCRVSCRQNYCRRSSLVARRQSDLRKTEEQHSCRGPKAARKRWAVRAYDTRNWGPRTSHGGRGKQSFSLSGPSDNHKIWWHILTRSKQGLYTYETLATHRVRSQPTVLATLVRRAGTLHDAQRLKEELQYLQHRFKQNSKSKSDFRWACNLKGNQCCKIKSPQMHSSYRNNTPSEKKKSSLLEKDNIWRIYIPNRTKLCKCWDLSRMDWIWRSPAYIRIRVSAA